MKFHRIGALLAASAAMTLSFGTVAAHASPTSRTLVPAGYKLITSYQYTAPPNSQTYGVVTCPNHEQPSGGGVFDDGGSDGINSSYPSGQSWEVYVNNPTSISGGFQVYAVCLAKSLSYTVASASFTATNGAQTTGTVTCPTGKVVVGGGAYMTSSSTAADFNTSIPQNNGWRVDLNNTSGADTTAYVYAVCHAKPKGYHITDGAEVAVTSGEFDALANVSCGTSPTNVAIGGGAYSTSSSTSVQTMADFPNGSGGWSMDEVNNSGSTTYEYPIAICAGI